ncbi:MAG: hypothetical protein ACE5F9_13540 [Phycisphaerae bacterium]
MPDDPTPPQLPPAALPEVTGYCWQCGYDLRGLAEPRCPECGFRFDLDAVRDLNQGWCLDRLHGLRNATLLLAAACTGLLISVLAPAAPFCFLWLLAVPVAVSAVRAIDAYLTGWRGRWPSRRAATPHLGRTFGSAQSVVELALVAAAAALLMWGNWFLFRLGLLLAGIFLAGAELQSFAQGKRRHKTSGAPDDLLRSIALSHGVTVILLIAAAVGLPLLLALGR